MNKNDGGYAFPYKEEDGQGGYVSGNGMTLRDYFAAAAISGFVQREHTGIDEDAKSAYLVADAMLAARDAK